MFACSDPGLTPVLRLRSAAAHAVQFWPAAAAAAAAAAGGGGGGAAAQQGGGGGGAQPQQQPQMPPGPPLLALDPPPSLAVTVAGRTVPRRVLQLFHPVDPFCMTVVQSFMQPTTLDVFYRA